MEWLSAGGVRGMRSGAPTRWPGAHVRPPLGSWTAAAAALCCAAGSWAAVGGTAQPQKRPGKSVTYTVRGTADAAGSRAPVVLHAKQRTNPKDGAEMVWIPPGPFQMGDSDQSDNPPRRVTLSGFWMYKNDVTVTEYRRFCDATGWRMPPAPSFDPTWSQSDHPIVWVTWDDAAAYAKWAGCELPTEAQWEKAARGTDGRKYPWGSDWDISKLWCSNSQYGDAGGTTAVGHYGMSPYGCSDMAGNVWDWCRDWYHRAFWSGRAGEQPDPVDLAPGLYRVVRGGSWLYDLPTAFSASYRYYDSPANCDGYNGFRCALRARPVPALAAPTTAVAVAAPPSEAGIGVQPPRPAAQADVPAKGAVRKNPKDGAEMVWIPPGPFQMGDSDQEDNPPHRVILSGFWMYKNDVTVTEYRRFCDATGRHMPSVPIFDLTWSQGDHPIVNVTWDDAAAYAKWAGCELPTEAQWEKAARGTDGRKYPWGSDWDISKLWCSKSLYGDAGGTTAVGHYGMSPYGCSDMAGNVWDWCRDWYHRPFWSGRAGEQPDPVDLAPGQLRVIRGGSWYEGKPGVFRSPYRWDRFPADKDSTFGFRCALRAGSP